MYMVKLQILCMVLTISLWNYYRKNRRVHTSSNILYMLMLYCLFVNLIFDMVTAYTVNHMQQVPEVINDVSHRIFLFTLNFFVFLLYLYLLSYVRTRVKQNWKLFVFSVWPFGLAFFLMFSGPIYYRMHDISNYSYGPFAYLIYVSSGFYIILTLYYCIRYHGLIERRVELGIRQALFWIICGSVIQALAPQVLISSGIQIMVVFTLFLSFENAAEILDNNTGVFNRLAFEKMVRDKKSAFGKPYEIYVFYLDETEQNRREALEIKLDRDLRINFHTDLYLITANCAAAILDENRMNEDLSGQIKKILPDNDNIEVLLCKSFEEVSDEEALVREIEELDARVSEHRRYFDEITGVKNRNAYERRVYTLNNKPEHLPGIQGIIVDVNRLKLVNDTYGHEAGDYVIRMTARILSEAVSNKEQIYRIGGDEFAIIMEQCSIIRQQEICEQIEQIRCRYNQTEKVQMEFSVGSAAFEEGRDMRVEDMMNRADREMYNKKREWYRKGHRYGSKRTGEERTSARISGSKISGA